MSYDPGLGQFVDDGYPSDYDPSGGLQTIADTNGDLFGLTTDGPLDGLDPCSGLPGIDCDGSPDSTGTVWSSSGNADDDYFCFWNPDECSAYQTSDGKNVLLPNSRSDVPSGLTAELSKNPKVGQGAGVGGGAGGGSGGGKPGGGSPPAKKPPATSSGGLTSGATIAGIDSTTFLIVAVLFFFAVSRKG